MRYLKLLTLFIRTSAQQELAYRANFWIHLLHAILTGGIGVAGVSVLFSRVTAIQGWDYPAVLAVLGVYLVVGALRSLVIGPSLDALAGMGQEVWSGKFDFTLLRPLDTQFLVSFRYWNLFALMDLALGGAVLAGAMLQPGQVFTLGQLAAFILALLAAMAVVYAVLLAFTGLVFWSPGFLFAWAFDAVFQMARYPVDLYPNWLRPILTWVIPVGLMTTLPARALTGVAPLPLALTSAGVAALLVSAASIFFRIALRQYASASS